MKRLLKPWIFALTAAFCLHAGVFLWFKDRHWSINTQAPAQVPNFEVSLLPAKSEPEIAPEPASEITSEPSNRPSPEPPAQAAVAAPAKDHALSDTAKPSETKSQKASTATPSSPAKNFSLDEISQAISQPISEHDWKSNSLLDIGPVNAERPKVDPSKDPFSPQFRQAILQAKNLQDEYSKGIVEQTEYPITEDADGTRYVNIKGICWKLPRPGSREEWQVVLSGCSGQKQTFRFELNITTDILQSELFQDLHFGARQ